MPAEHGGFCFMHSLLMQSFPMRHAALHALQCAGSDVVSTHVPSQSVNAGPHMTPPSPPSPPAPPVPPEPPTSESCSSGKVYVQLASDPAASAKQAQTPAPSVKTKGTRFDFMPSNLAQKASDVQGDADSSALWGSFELCTALHYVSYGDQTYLAAAPSTFAPCSIKCCMMLHRPLHHASPCVA